jgi:hypothetical protein
MLRHRITGMLYMCLDVLGELCEVISADDLLGPPVRARMEFFEEIIL